MIMLISMKRIDRAMIAKKNRCMGVCLLRVGSGHHQVPANRERGAPESTEPLSGYNI